MQRDWRTSPVRSWVKLRPYRKGSCSLHVALSNASNSPSEDGYLLPERNSPGIAPCQDTIHQAPDRLRNPRETKAFAVRNGRGKWSIATVQIGNNFAHTVRSGAAECFLVSSMGYISISRDAATDLPVMHEADSQFARKLLCHKALNRWANFPFSYRLPVI